MKRRPRLSSSDRSPDRQPPDRNGDRYDSSRGGREYDDYDRSSRYEAQYSENEGDRYSSRNGDRNRRSTVGSILSSTTLAILGAVLVLGIGVGAFFGYTANTSSGGTIDTRVEIDASVPNAELCAQYGAGAIAVDLRAFVTLSPFKVFISQPLMQPGCVLRTNNWNILQQRDVIDADEARECKQRMNTFGFTGNIEQGGEDSAKVDCVYANDAARNLFIKNGLGTGLSGDRF